MQDGFPDTVKAKHNLPAKWTLGTPSQHFHHPRKRGRGTRRQTLML